MSQTGVVSWSQTAATNASADPAVNWAEGQAPSSVNDSARAGMASVAKWRDDLNGSITTGGSSTAYTLSSNQVFAALTASYEVAFVVHATNGATVTLNVDSLGAKPLRSAPGVELPAGVLIQGTPYMATYYTSNSGEWILQGFYGNPYNVPIGGMMPYLANTAPNSNFVFPYGQAISRTTYSTLFGLIGTTFGTGDGATTFNVINMREKTIAGWAGMGGGSASAITTAGSGIDGATIGASGGAQNHVLTKAEAPTGLFTLTDPGHVHDLGVQPNGSLGTQSYAAQSGQTGAPSAGFVRSNTTGISISDHGGDTAHINMQPTIIVPWLLRII